MYTDSKNGVEVVVNADGKVVTVKTVKQDKGSSDNNKKGDEKKDDKKKEERKETPKTE